MLKKIQHLNQILPKHYRIVDASDHRMAHLTHPRETAQNAKMEHIRPERFADWFAFYSVWILITMVNIMSGFMMKPITQNKWITRSLLIETISAIPGLVESVYMHFRSVTFLSRDKGWILHMLQESDNQRFHFITFANLKKPSIFLRVFMIIQQVMFGTYFFIAYLISPRYCHKFVAYLEEHAFKNYSDMLKQIDRKDGRLSHWKQVPANKESIEYYQFDQSATLRDLILAIRSDQVFHQESNHFFGQVDRNFDLEEQKIRIYHDRNQSKKKMGQ